MIGPIKLGTKNLLSISDLTNYEINFLIELAYSFKKKELKKIFKEKVLGLIFDKASTRTRVSFQVGMSRLGGSSIDLNPSTSQLGRGELIKDTARVLSKYCDVLAIRTSHHSNIEEYAKWSSKPIINALTDLEHPCQALADFMTIKEEFGDLQNKVLAYIGDGNNVAHSLILGGAILGCEVRIGCPKGYEPNPKIVNKAMQIGESNFSLKVNNNAYATAAKADVIYTDVWASMGEEEEKDAKEKDFIGYTVNENLLSYADKNAIVLHCLPAYRGKEITDEIIESQNCRIFEQAENRMHVQQALLSCLLA
tara:strand:+ start:371 stop:1297 length:927 start_codon:yes stop_codon:yes gene_type:complete